MRNIFDYNDNLHVMDHIPAILKWGSLNGPKPDVSILMPVFNHPHFFKIALETALNQDYQGNYEIIVLDNNQDDDVDNVNEFEQYVIEKNNPKILYYKNEHNIQGINNYNRLPQLARADYFTFLHDDDELTKNCLTTLVNVKNKKHLTDELIVPTMNIIDTNSNIISETRKRDPLFLFLKSYRMKLYDWLLKSQTNGCGTLHSKKAFLELGGYNSEYIPSADYAFYSLYVYKYGGIALGEALFNYRVAENDSMIVYKQCLKRGDEIRDCIKQKINLPQKFLERIIKAKKNINLNRSEELFTGSIEDKVKSGDRLVFSCAYIIKFISHII